MNKQNKLLGRVFGLAVLLGLAGSASAQTDPEPPATNAGADVVITEINGLVVVAASVVGAAILVVVVPWGAKMAVRAFKSLAGG